MFCARAIIIQSIQTDRHNIQCSESVCHLPSTCIRPCFVANTSCYGPATCIGQHTLVCCASFWLSSPCRMHTIPSLLSRPGRTFAICSTVGLPMSIRRGSLLPQLLALLLPVELLSVRPDRRRSWITSKSMLFKNWLQHRPP